MRDGDACANGHGGHQDSDCPRRHRSASMQDDHERDRGPQSDQYDAVGDVAGAGRAQVRHRRQGGDSGQVMSLDINVVSGRSPVRPE
jgi:hypothetical protein